MGHMNVLFRLVMLLTAGALCALIGCADNGPYMTKERLDQGMVMILPGIEGVSQLNKDIRDGLGDAGIEWAMPIESWGRPVPLFGMFLNQMDIIGNRIAAAGLANQIEDYIDEYPGRPVYLIGHSGGGGIAVFVAEALDEGYMVDGVIVLSGSISIAYNLEKALGKTRLGIVNFYNRSDGGLLGAGTTLLGNVDGIRGPGAGLLGFDWPDDDDDAAKRLAYMDLYQVQLERDMILGGDSHTAVTDPVFVSTFIGPWVYSNSWPATYNAQAASYDPPVITPEEPETPETPVEVATAQAETAEADVQVAQAAETPTTVTETLLIETEPNEPNLAKLAKIRLGRTLPVDDMPTNHEDFSHLPESPRSGDSTPASDD
jgi:pimeloyl-ACP methyl ester carboxylesterase